MSGFHHGGCQCGRIRYTVRIDGEAAYFCHCGMCRKATGGVAAPFVTVQRGAVAWEAAAPDLYRSSPVAERGFCAACGSPLSFAYVESDEIDLTIGSFDDPGAFVPHHQFSVETRLDAWVDTRALPAEPLAAEAPRAQRWIDDHAHRAG